MGAPGPDFIPWRPSEAEIARIKNGGKITPAARWDSASPEQRAAMGHPEFNPQKRWFEQHANRAVQFSP